MVPEELQPALRLTPRGAERAGADEVATNPRAASGMKWLGVTIPALP